MVEPKDMSKINFSVTTPSILSWWCLFKLYKGKYLYNNLQNQGASGSIWYQTRQARNSEF